MTNVTLTHVLGYDQYWYHHTKSSFSLISKMLRQKYSVVKYEYRATIT